MARAKASTWFNLIAGLLVGASAQPHAFGQAPGAAPVTNALATPDAASSPSGPTDLTAAAEAIRRGDYDRAAVLLKHAAAVAAVSSVPDAAAEHEWSRLNDALSVAVQARRAGSEQVRLAEEAIQQGNEARASDLLRHVAANEPFLTEVDRQRLQLLTAKVRAQAPSAADKPANTVASPGGALATAQARAKLQMARAQMGQYNFERAEQLVHEAEHLQPKLSANEDNPKKVLDDLTHLRTDPKALLTAARVSLGRKDYDRAEQFARMSEKNSGPFTFPFWGDNPSRVLKDVQELRAHAPIVAANKTPPTSAKPPTSAPAQPVAAKPPIQDPKVVPAAAIVKAPEPPKPAPGSPEATHDAIELVKQARQALTAGDVAKARKLNDQARALKPNLHWWEDNPEKVQADIVRAEAKVKPTTTQVAATVPAKAPAVDKSKPPTKEEAVALVKQGRALLAENKIDEANKVWLKARVGSLSWGLFEDTPEKLHQDIDKARVKRDREESVKVLAEARRLYEEGKYDEAERAAYRAHKLHGAYSVWELGDRPERVLADVQTAKNKLAKGQPVEIVKRTPPAKPADAVAQQPVTPAATPDAKMAQARQMLADARTALRAGDTGRAKALAEQVQSMHLTLTARDDTPEAVLKDVQRATVANARPSSQAPPAEDNKNRVVRLLAEAHELDNARHLVEARAKVLEALQLHVPFRPGEESPELLMQNLSAKARWQVERTLRDAATLTETTGPNMVAQLQQAEQSLMEARKLALGFGLDAQPIDSRLDRVHAQQAIARGDAAPAAGSVAAAPKNPGQEMLEKARLELQRGETENAHKLAEAAASGPYGVQEEAFAVLRSIAAEEINQRRLQSTRTFDAAMAAYNRRDFAHAGILLQSVDSNNLDDARRARLREIAMTPEMQPAGQSPVTRVQATGDQPLPAVPAPPSGPMLGEQPGFARATDPSLGDALLSQTEAMQQVKFQKLRQDGQEVQREAAEKFRTGQTDAAIDMLQDYLARLNDAQLDAAQVTLLRRQPEARLQQFKLLKAQRDFLAENEGSVKRVHEEKTRELLNEQNKQKKVAELMKQYNTLYAEGKYPQAERLAMQAHELDPDNPIAAAAVTIARNQRHLKTYNDVTKKKGEAAWEQLTSTDDIGPVGVDTAGIAIDPESSARALERSKKYGMGITAGVKTEKAREIERRLLSPVTLNFAGTPLKSIIDDLRAWQGINIFVDESALQEENISLDQPVTIKLEQIAMKYALNHLLSGTHLAWTIRDDVLLITTPKHTRGALETRTLAVADLVIPVTDFGSMKSPNTPQLPSNDVGRMPLGPAPATPWTTAVSLPPGEAAGSSSGSRGAFGSDANSAQPQVARSGPTGTTEEKLMALIKNTVQPFSWTDSGGSGTIDYFPLTMSLVINQTPDIQEQVADLLGALRRLQDQEVAVEIRFITVEDSFFERIGVNFNLNIQTKNTQIQPQLTSGVFTPDGYINAFAPKNTIVGLQPSGTFTPDLNVPIQTNTYTATVPDFGGYQPTPGFGGLTVGLAFLSDIQVFLFLEAVQGDTRTNVMQAPKLTMFNGQTATISVSDFQNFVTGVQVGNTSGLYTFTPIVQQFPIGVNLAMNAVISADRRFVRMSLAPVLTSLATQTVNLFPVVVPIFPQLDGTGTGQPVVFTQYIQQPVINTVSVATTVAVPDGGTVLMGGLKLLSEERKEYGPPILSKIPYLSRLFKNTSYGRDAQSLLIMVTPRIIIQEEEEFRQTGVDRVVPPSF